MKQVLSLFLTMVFGVSMVVTPATGLASTETGIEGIPYDVQEQFKSALLEKVVNMYTHFSSLDESAVHVTLLEEVTAKRDAIMAQAFHIEDAAVRHQAVSQITTKFEEMRSSILSQTKDQILENLLVAQEELTHLGPLVVLKGTVAVLGTVAVFPVFIAGCLLFVVGEVVYWGTLTLLAPVAIAIDVVGLALAGGSLAAAGVMWAWAVTEE